GHERTGREMHDRLRLERLQGRLNFVGAGQIAFDEFRAWIYSGPMPFGKIIEDANRVSFIEEHFGADAADVARASDHENSHRARCRATACRSKQTNRVSYRPRLRLSVVPIRQSSAGSGDFFHAVSEP